MKPRLLTRLIRSNTKIALKQIPANERQKARNSIGFKAINAAYYSMGLPELSRSLERDVKRGMLPESTAVDVLQTAVKAIGIQLLQSISSAQAEKIAGNPKGGIEQIAPKTPFIRFNLVDKDAKLIIHVNSSRKKVVYAVEQIG